MCTYSEIGGTGPFGIGDGLKLEFPFGSCFVLVRVISWIVPLRSQKENDPR